MAGKQFYHAKTYDMWSTIETIRYYAGWAGKDFGQTIPVRWSPVQSTYDV